MLIDNLVCAIVIYKISKPLFELHNTRTSNTLIQVTVRLYRVANYLQWWYVGISECWIPNINFDELYTNRVCAPLAPAKIQCFG